MRSAARRRAGLGISTPASWPRSEEIIDGPHGRRGDPPGHVRLVRSAEHCPDADEEIEVLLIEPRDTVNTGDAGGEMTAEPRLL
jgi:hypothetical protein